MRYQGHVLSLAFTIATAKAFNFEAPAPSCQTLQENWTSNTYFPNDTLYTDLNTGQFLFFSIRVFCDLTCLVSRFLHCEIMARPSLHIRADQR